MLKGTKGYPEPLVPTARVILGCRGLVGSYLEFYVPVPLGPGGALSRVLTTKFGERKGNGQVAGDDRFTPCLPLCC